MVNVVVVGAGIIGVTTAYRLKLKYPSDNVTVVAKQFSPNTTSDGSTGFWNAFEAGDTSPDLILRLSKETYDHLFEAMQQEPSICCHGIHSTHGVFLYEEKPDVSYLSDVVYDFQWLQEKDLKRFPENFKYGCQFTSLIIESKKYIPWLSKKYVELGGVFLRKEIHNLSELGKDYDIVVNCCGLGALQLLNDNNCFPIRGQLLRVKAPWINGFVTGNYKDHTFSHIMSVNDHVVIGGVAQPHETNKAVDETDKKWILKSTRSLVPSLKYADELEDWVGFRPGRSKLRLEKEDIACAIGNGKQKVIKVIHNYGHGGFGITTHWGCAGDAVKMVGQAIEIVKTRKSKL